MKKSNKMKKKSNKKKKGETGVKTVTSVHLRWRRLIMDVGRNEGSGRHKS